ncbi:MAG: M4 family metallopeptidase [Myxococcota bacterium]|nr:M4 family metallopeptidase [Myxococcota bacterium]
MSTGPINKSLVRPVTETLKPTVAAPVAPANTVATAKTADAFAAGSVAQPVALKGNDGKVHLTQAGDPANSCWKTNEPRPMSKPLDIESEAVKAMAVKIEAAVPEQLPQLGEAASFELWDAETDDMGMSHVRMSRQHNGLPVFGEQIIGHLDAKGEVASVTGLVGTIPAELGKGEPKMSAAEAATVIEKAFKLAPGTVPPEEMHRTIVQNLDGTYRDTWEIERFFAASLPDGDDAAGALVDMESGTLEPLEGRHGVIDERQMERAKKAVADAEKAGTLNLPSEAVKGRTVDQSVGNDTSNYSGKVEIGGTQRPDGTEQMVDSTRGQGIETVDAEGRKRDKPAPIDFVDNNGAWGETSDPKGQKTGVDAQYGAQMTSDFLRDILGRDSIDGRGEKLRSTVNVRLEDSKGNISPNAFWNGTEMTYGMGDGTNILDLTTLDIAGHEISHGLTSRTAGLIYRNESGGVNESMADIIGAGVEWYAAQKNGQVEWNFLIGEQAFTPGVEGDGLRDMANPLVDRYSIDNYSLMGRYKQDGGVGAPDPRIDKGGVHGSSGIMNNAFTMTAAGGKNQTSGKGVEEGIGMEASLKIFGRALQFYMTPNTTFAHAAESTVRAATDLFGTDSKEVATLKQAWAAVGVEAK